jgi:sugar phosphate isomerase/epimerase
MPPDTPVTPSRRRFLALAAGGGAVFVGGIALGRAGRSGIFSRFSSSKPAPPEPFTPPPLAPGRFPVGIELYGVRDELTKDLPNTLRTVAKMGYEVVEFYAPYFDWTKAYAKEVKLIMDDAGLRCYSTHNHVQAFTAGWTMDKAAELNQILGSRYLVMASAPPVGDTADGWKRLCAQLTEAVARLNEHGLTAGFHNHDAEWAKISGETRIMDLIAANTPKEFALQLDVGTCVKAGADPVAWIKANPGRIKSLHLKDWAPGTAEEEKSYRVLFGEGSAPWKEICQAAESVGGVEYYLMEQEGSRFSEFETAQRCLNTWKTMRTAS